MSLGLGLNISKHKASVSVVRVLDLVPGASAAYSLRLLSSSYSGSSIEVRRSSDNALADIGFLADGSLDTVALLAHTGANNGFVSKFYDQSGNTADALQAVNASQPKIVTTGTVILDNGNPAIDFITSTATWLKTGAITSISQPATYFSISNAVTTTAAIGFDGNAVLSGSYTILNATDIRNFAGATLSKTITSTQVQLATFLLFNGVSSAIADDNNTSTTGDAGATNIGVSLVMGIAANLASSPWNGFIQEHIVYPTDQTSNRTIIQDNQNAFYSVF